MLTEQASEPIGKILLIDDELTTRLILQKNLQDEQYQVKVATNGKEGLMIAEEFCPDLIICDWMMPVLDGLEVCQQIKANTQLYATFFILLTGREQVSDRVKGLDSGADEFLCKPIDLNELKARVRAGLRISRLNQQLKATNEELSQVNKQLKVRNELLESLSMTDAMTGLLNRRALDQSLPHLLAQVGKRDGTEIHYRYLCIFMIDVDYFKQVNDNYGHKIGDNVLKILAQRLQANVRPNSSVYRYGGEEIVCVTQGIHPKKMRDYGESLRKAIADHPFKVSGDLQLGITISLGGAIASETHSFKAHDLLHQADLALYQAKHNGRNCLRFSPEAELLINTNPV
ncbi:MULTISPECIES: diguanylate cyclase [Planktothricoides]|uniref:Diguanylate cyclase n=1 Tax=Planktothricoides raciborskii GIHE-MW2 TaxID=2792601 RepID=A0AAU8J7K4_9CYAN|nr:MULTISPECIES: diguanylate cyclase [Planktothricoides]KOR34682.1 response regulator [Planktothricoides sp. SR001]